MVFEWFFLFIFGYNFALVCSQRISSHGKKDQNCIRELDKETWKMYKFGLLENFWLLDIFQNIIFIEHPDIQILMLVSVTNGYQRVHTSTGGNSPTTITLTSILSSHDFVISFTPSSNSDPNKLTWKKIFGKHWETVTCWLQEFSWLSGCWSIVVCSKSIIGNRCLTKVKYDKVERKKLDWRKNKLLASNKCYLQQVFPTNRFLSI